MTLKPDSQKNSLAPQMLERLANGLLNINGLQAAYLHGSAARGALRADSDLDIALLFASGAKADPLGLLECAGALESLVGRPVHFGVLDLKSPVFAKEVYTHAITLFEVDGGYAPEFWMYALAYYAELNEQRRPVLQAYGVKP